MMPFVCEEFNSQKLNTCHYVFISQTALYFCIVLFALMQKEPKNYFANNVFSMVSMSASQFKAKPDRSARFCHPSLPHV